MPAGGWAWRSSIQAPHFQTDRDVGAASIGEGLLAAHAVTGDSSYLHAATEAGDFLIGVAEPSERGLRWPDWADADGRRSETHYTSFDDGAAGISDFLWHLHAATGEPRSAKPRSTGCAGWCRRPRDRTARRRAAPGTGPTIRIRTSPTTASGWATRESCSRSMRSPTAPETHVPPLRALGRRGLAGTDGERRSPAPARIGRRHVRNRLPLRLGRRCVHVPLPL